MMMIWQGDTRHIPFPDGWHPVGEPVVLEDEEMNIWILERGDG